ncbi:MAG TPA: hypothetical protein VHL59_00285 [Thermoanaerobaculia bacterium]|nr:hypothetical protein [Thermoanaerobaculia bacterium]
MNAETVQIDVAFWFMFDHSLDKLAAGGIPMRDYKATDGIQHWKMMLFAGQNVVQFSAANYGGNDFVPRALRY